MTKKQINQSILLEEIMKHQIIVSLLTIVDEIHSDSLITNEDVTESLLSIIDKNDLSRGDINRIWTKSP